MTKVFRLAGLAACTALLVGCALQGQTKADPLPTWLTGCWISSDGQQIEAWSDDGEALIGFSSVAVENRTVFHELMSIRRNDQGTLVFTAYPSNQPGGSFPAEQATDNLIVFFNDQHDYPQRIRYQREGDRLFADISRADGSDRRNFVKQRCPDRATGA
ncbi:MAG: DUF6265 family protein [Pseudomonadota bacterium]